MKIALLTSLLTCLLTLLCAQETFQLSDFLLDGSTRLTGDRCFQLVPDRERSSGSLWHKKPIDLSQPLDMELKVMMGCKDRAGADGIVLAFSPEAVQTGWSGEGMGFAGLSPSLGIEIDTWENEHLLDPAEDHMAIMANGNVRHRLNLAGPKIIPNIEDCRLHLLRIQWQPSQQRLSVTLDQEYQIVYTGNIIRYIFEGNPRVYWGITAATGKYSNRHEFCIEKLEYTTPKVMALDFDDATRKKLLKGENVSLKDANFSSGSTELSEEASAAAERLLRFLKKHPKHHVSISGHTDSAGDATKNQALSERRAKAIADYLKREGIKSERIEYGGYGERYPKADNASAAGRKKNRRIDVFVFVPQV
ncbi:MAG: OmpA family protein [Bacteroidota bacterium]